MGIIYGGAGGGGGGGTSFNFAPSGALLSYTIPGIGPQYLFAQHGTDANKPAASAYNVGMKYRSDDLDGGTEFTNFNGTSWEITGVGVNFQTDAMRYKRAALATILATAGDFIGQNAYCTDYGLGPGLRLVWLPSAAWGLPTDWQLHGRDYTDHSCGADTTEDTLFTQPGTGGLPHTIWRPNDSIRIRTVWLQSTANTNARTCKYKVGGVNVVSQNITSTTKAAWIHEYDLHFRNALTAQIGGAVNFDVFGQLAAAAGVHAVDFTADAPLLITGTKANSGDTLTLQRVEVYLRGGG